MSKNSGWIPLDKNLKWCLPTDRPYTKLEAMFSHQLDIDQENGFSVNGYAKLWQWSRNKVRFFINNIKKVKGHPKGQVRDTLGTGKGQGVHLIILDLQKQKDTLGTGKGQVRDTPKDTTIKIDKRKTKKRYAEFVLMTGIEYGKLIDSFGQYGADDRIENLNLWKGSKGKKTNSDYMTILSWERKNGKEQKGNQIL